MYGNKLTIKSVLTDIGDFDRLDKALGYLGVAIFQLGVPDKFKLMAYFSYIKHIVCETNPDLTDDFVDKIDWAIMRRCNYRTRNGIKLNDIDKVKDTFEHLNEDKGLKEYFEKIKEQE